MHLIVKCGGPAGALGGEWGHGWECTVVGSEVVGSVLVPVKAVGQAVGQAVGCAVPHGIAGRGEATCACVFGIRRTLLLALGP